LKQDSGKLGKTHEFSIKKKTTKPIEPSSRKVNRTQKRPRRTWGIGSKNKKSISATGKQFFNVSIGTNNRFAKQFGATVRDFKASQYGRPRRQFATYDNTC